MFFLDLVHYLVQDIVMIIDKWTEKRLSLTIQIWNRNRTTNLAYFDSISVKYKIVQI